MTVEKEVPEYLAVCSCLATTTFDLTSFPVDETKTCEKCGKKIRLRAHSSRGIIVYYGV